MAENKLHKPLNEKITKEAENTQNNIFSQDGILRFHFMTSLENIAIIKVVTDLWIDQCIQEKLIKIKIMHNKLPSYTIPDLKEVENYVIAKVSQLYTAKSIAKKLTDIVPITGSSIFNWIEYHDKHVFDVKVPFENSAVYFINNIIWTTGGKIDYAQTARNILADRYICLSDDHKFKLACNCCLEEEISAIAPNVLNTTYLDSVDIYDFPMIHFWSAKITDDYTYENYRHRLWQHSKTKTLDNLSLDIYYKRNINTSIYMHILRLLTEDNIFSTKICNSVPIVYLCSILSEKRKVAVIVPIINVVVCKENLFYSILSNLNYEQQKEVLMQCSERILCIIIHDIIQWIWLKREHFLQIALHLLDFIEPESYMYVLYKVLEEKQNLHEKSSYIYDQYKSIFMDLWQHGSKRLKDYIFHENNIYLLERFVTYYLSWNRDMDTIEMIFNDLNTEQEKRIRLGRYGMRYCSYLMLYNQWELLELYIKYALFPQKYSSCINQRHIKEIELRTYESFLDALSKREYFHTFFDKDVTLREIPSYTRCKTIFELLSDQTQIDFKLSEDNLKWYFSKNVKEIKWFQEYFPEFFFWILTVCKLVEEDKYEMLYHIINIFPTD